LLQLARAVGETSQYHRLRPGAVARSEQPFVCRFRSVQSATIRRDYRQRQRTSVLDDHALLQLVERPEDIFSHPIKESFRIAVSSFVKEEDVVSLRDKICKGFPQLFSNGDTSNRLIESDGIWES